MGEKGPWLSFRCEIDTGAEGDEYPLQSGKPSLVSALKGNDRRLSHFDEHCEFTLAHAAMSPQARELLPKSGTGGEIAAHYLKPEVFEDRPPRVEIPPALLQETNRPLSKLYLRSELTLGETHRLAVLPELATESEIGRNSGKTDGSMGRNRQEV